MEVVNERDYRMQTKLSEGGMGEIWLCDVVGEILQGRAEANVCVAKVCKSERLRHCNLFRQEVTVSYHVCEHRNIVKVIGFANQPLSMLAPFFPEGSLFKLIQRESIPPQSQTKFATDIARGLRHIHQLMIAHCDIKPENILLKQEPARLVAAITDFGIARILDEKKHVAAGFHNIKLDGASLYYAAPEVWRMLSKDEYRSSPVIKAGDVYGFAVVMYAMATGRTPWRGDRSP